MTATGTLICFTGIDGSGKTTQARMLVDWLASRGVKAMYTWSRGEVLGIRQVLLFLGRRAVGTSTLQIQSSKASYSQYQSRKSRLMRNALVRTLWSIMTYGEHFVQINRDIRSSLQDGVWVVCDRYQWDSLIDLAVLNNKRSEWLLSGFNRSMWKYIPQPAITFLVDVPPEEAMRRKNDIPSLDYVQRRREHYLYLAENSSMMVIDGCRTAPAIHAEITDALSSYMDEKGSVCPG